jgi:hypothetical protein
MARKESRLWQLRELVLSAPPARVPFRRARFDTSPRLHLVTQLKIDKLTDINPLIVLP